MSNYSNMESSSCKAGDSRENGSASAYETRQDGQTPGKGMEAYGATSAVETKALANEVNDRFDACKKTDYYADESQSEQKFINRFDACQKKEPLENSVEAEGYESAIKDQREQMIQHDLQQAVEYSESAESFEDSFQQLQQRYDNALYGDIRAKAAEKELADIQKENYRLSQQAKGGIAALDTALSASMARMGEYVRSNNMDRADTRSDQYYASLVEEHNRLQQQKSSLVYGLQKMEEDNKQIEEITGCDYELDILEQEGYTAFDVREGVDMPDKTEYFEERRAEKVLGKFKDGNWERLDKERRMLAVDRLARMNADALDIEKTPELKFVKMKPNEYGTYNHSTNTIEVNRSLLKNPEELAKTLSHEYRHTYQYQRIEKLETARDVDFYVNACDIKSTDNGDTYQEYYEQIMEKDARAFEDMVAAKLRGEKAVKPEEDEN